MDQVAAHAGGKGCEEDIDHKPGTTDGEQDARQAVFSQDEPQGNSDDEGRYGGGHTGVGAEVIE